MPHRRRDLEERPAAPPGEELGDVERAPTAQADDRPELRQPGDLFVERRDLDRRDLVDGGEMAVEVVLEPRPQVGHRHDDVGAMDEVRQLLDQLPTEDGREAGVDRLRPQLDGGHGRRRRKQLGTRHQVESLRVVHRSSGVCPADDPGQV